jgi:acyl-CoA synthetase (AMP-forming)/AMP-acid ligase II
MSDVSIERIHDLLVRSGAAGSALAAAGPGERLTYDDLIAQVDGFARALLAAGVRRGDRVAMLTIPSVEFWRVLHAAASIGAIWVGVNPRYQSRDIGHVLGDAEPSLILINGPADGRDYPGEVRGLAPETRLVDLAAPDARAAFLARGAAVSDADLHAARAVVSPGDGAVIVYTSGTTGKPKGAVLSHRAIALSAQANAAWMGAADLSRAVCAAPVNHVGAINNICMNVMAGGGAVIFYPEVDIPALADLSRREQPTYLVSSPTGFAMMLGAPDGIGARLATTRLIVFGGAATALSTLEQIAPCGARLSSVYGQTETCGIITHTDPADSLEDHALTIGRALAGSEIRIGAPDGGEAPVGVAGEIQIRAPYVMTGYFNNPEATAEAFTADGFLRTGDLGLRRADGQLVFVGRLKEMFKSGGYNVYPVEVEQAICEYPGAALAAVVAAAHPTFQEVGVAFIEPERGAALEGAEILAFLRARIANYKIPKQLYIEAQLPRLPNGKVDKSALARRVSDLALWG